MEGGDEKGRRGEWDGVGKWKKERGKEERGGAGKENPRFLLTSRILGLNPEKTLASDFVKTQFVHNSDHLLNKLKLN